MTPSEIQQPLCVSQSPRRQLSTLGPIAVILCAYVLLGVFNVVDGWLMWLGIAVFGAILLIGIYGVFRARTSSWELRLDEQGATAHGSPTMPWSDLVEVRVTGLRPHWLFLARRPQVVAFVGRPGVVMPSLPSARGTSMANRSTRLRERLYGTQMLLITQAFDAPTDTILDAVERFSDVPVVRG